MKTKVKITKEVLTLLNRNSDEASIKKILPTMWISTRKKDNGGLRLTALGFDLFKKAEIKFYRIQFANQIYFSNQLLIWLDNFIDCPFYITNKEIFVSSEKMAIQLVLFEGNIYNFTHAKARSRAISS